MHCYKGLKPMISDKKKADTFYARFTKNLFCFLS